MRARDFAAPWLKYLAAGLMLFGGTLEASAVEVLSQQQGEEWTYGHIDLWTNKSIGETTRTVESVGDEGFKVRHVELDGAEYTELVKFDGSARRPMPPRSKRDGDFEYVWLKFPLVSGSSWETTTYRWWYLSNVIVRVEWSCKVKGSEMVEVPAGKFETVRVDCDGWWYDRGWSGKEDQTLWFAPSVNWIVKNRYIERTSRGRPWSQWESSLVRHSQGLKN